MQTNKKVLFIVFGMLSLLSIAIIINVWIHFVNFGNKASIEKANSIAESVRDGLTAHMVHNAMDTKEIFLRNMIKHQKVETLRVIRSKENMKEFDNERVQYASYDEIEKQVLKYGKTISKIESDFLRITIPYIAYSTSEPDCLSCHTSISDGDVLGAITLELNINDVKTSTYKTIFTLISISILFLFISYLIAIYFIKPYIKLFDDLEEGISRAYKGDFSHQVSTKLSNDAGKVAKRLNDLSEIFRFKKTIELDSDTQTIYERLSYILEDNFNIKEYIMFENNVKDKTREIVYKSAHLTDIDIKEIESSKHTCRAFRTGDIVSSTDFHKVCKLCYSQTKETLCLPFNISEDLTLTLLVYVDSEEELDRVDKLVPILTNYFQLAEPVLQTKILMDKLHKTTLIDPMTSLHNRRFLDGFLDTEIEKYKNYSILMVDIDYFKQVNDTYGHHIGDKVIKSVAEVLINNIKGSDYAIRFGGEEFLLITFDTPKEISIKIANTIRNEFATKVFKADKETFSKTLSVGIANFPDDAASPWQCIKFADLALYYAKEHGRNQVISFDSHMYQEDMIQ